MPTQTTWPWTPDVNTAAISYSRGKGTAETRRPRVIARHQAFLFFPLLLLLGWSMHVASLAFLLRQRSRHHRLEFALLALHVLLYTGFLVYFLGPWSAMLAIAIHQCCSGFYMALVFAPNHKGMPQVDDSSELDFLRKQVLTSRNVRSHPLTDLWYGHLIIRSSTTSSRRWPATVSARGTSSSAASAKNAAFLITRFRCSSPTESCWGSCTRSVRPCECPVEARRAGSGPPNYQPSYL